MQAPTQANTRSATATPIPALAPVERPRLLDVEFASEDPVARMPLLPVRIADPVPVVAAQ